jgi:uncharacterized protein YpuA (DUF1002 family)
MVETNEILKFRYNDDGEREVYPVHFYVSNCVFKDNEEDEATLVNYISKVGAKNGLTVNDITNVFPYILRMLKSDIDWSK